MTATVELAKRLGLVSYIKFDQQSSGGAANSKENQLKFLFVIDFESTCWEKKTGTPLPEIIEFPVVLLCLQTGAIMSEFHHYVQPTENPRLSPFCRDLTGITQEQVDEGVPLATCLMLYKQWLDTVTREHNIVFTSPGQQQPPEAKVNLATCVTWSDWDLSLCLESECQRKQIRKPACFDSWIDIRAVYRSFFTRRPQGLNNALKEVGLLFEGREHSGIEDARNTARLVWRMVQDGCVLHVTSTRDESSGLIANTAHRKHSTNKDEDEGSSRRSKWRKFKPDQAPSMPTGISKLDNNKVKLDSKVAKTPVKRKVKPVISPNPQQSTPLIKKVAEKSRNDSGYESPLSAHVDGTPPLCQCGRRSRKRQVYKAGPNTGRIFWSCSLKGRNTKAGCDFFLWASHGI